MKVVLISPPTHFEHSPPMPSLGLGILSASLEREDIETVCIDCNLTPGVHPLQLLGASDQVEGRYLHRLLTIVADTRPDLIGISSWGVSLPFAMRFARAIQELLPGIPIVSGGIRYDGLARAILEQEPSITAVVVGDGDTVIAPLVRAILHKSRRAQDIPPGVLFRKGLDIETSGPSEALPAQQWVRPSYESFLFKPHGQFLVEGSRGCSHQCVFCCLNHEPLRRRDPESLANEIAVTCEQQDVNVVSLTDNFIPLHGSWTQALCRELEAKLPGIRWVCCARADHISLPTVDAMVKSGCTGVFLGVESVSDTTLAYIKKTPSPEAYCRGIGNKVLSLAERGLHVRASTIVGFPHEGVGDMERTFDFVLNMIEAGVKAYVGVPMVYPGSQLWALYRAGKIDITAIENKRLFRNHGGLFAAQYAHSPWFVPNQYMPRHAFLPQQELEEFLDRWFLSIEQIRTRPQMPVPRPGAPLTSHAAGNR